MPDEVTKKAPGLMLGGFWCVKRGCRQLPEAVSRSMIRMMMAGMAFISFLKLKGWP